MSEVCVFVYVCSIVAVAAFTLQLKYIIMIIIRVVEITHHHKFL